MSSQVFNYKAYDPNGVIVSPSGNAVDFRSIPPFLRTLLVTDGTVTKSLEAYFWEPIAVITERQECTRLVQASPLLKVAEAEPVIVRDVRLQGATSKHVYTRASSVLVIKALSESISEQILAGTMGIGELLRSKGMSTYREIMDFGYCSQATEATLFRTYVINHEDQPAIQITERFPCHLYQ